MTAVKTSLKKRIHAVSNVKCGWIFQEMNSKGLSKFWKRIRKLLSCVMSSRKREIGQFQVVVALQGQKKVQKKSVMHLQGCCFAYLNVLIFCRSCCCPHSHCLKLPINSNIPQNSQVVSNCKPIAFLPFSLLSSPSLLKLPINSNIP